MVNIGDTKIKKKGVLISALKELINSMQTTLFQQEQSILWDLLKQCNDFFPSL